MDKEINNLIDAIGRWFRTQGLWGVIECILLFLVGFFLYFCTPLAPIR